MATGISETTAQDTARAGLVAAITAALAAAEETAVDVGSGFRWPIVNNDWIYAVDTESDIDPKDIGPRRTLTERITLHVSFGAWLQYADETTELATFNRAFSLLKLVQNWVRTNDITLGGVVLWCLPGSSSAAGATTQDESGEGRLTEVAATFVCSHRIQTA